MRAVCLLLLTACRPPAPALDGVGGESWAFSQRITGTADPACREVRVASARGSVVAARDGDRFAARVPLAHGTNEVTASCVAGGRTATSAPQSWDVRLPDRPTARIRSALTADGLLLDAGPSAPSPARPARIASWAWSVRDDAPGPLTLAEGAALEDAVGNRVIVAPPETDGTWHVTVEVVDDDGISDASTVVFHVEDGAFVLPDLLREHPAWVDDAVVYGVVPSLFGDRGLPDVTARLDDLADLGITVLWLSPINDAPDGDFGYATTDHLSVAPRYGTEADLRALVDAAHARGMRVVMDFVPNHTSDRHRWYRDVIAHGSDSPHHDQYEWGEDAYYFAWENLRNLDYDDPEVRAHVTEAFAHWVRDVGIDGFRVDVAWGVQRRRPSFWPELSAELHRIDPDILMLAEASGRDGWWYDNGFDAAYDWTDQLGQWAWEDAFDGDGPVAPPLRDALTAGGRGWHPDALVMRFLDNNDTGERFADRHGPDATVPAAALLLTAPGIPALYTGSEVGAAYHPYDDDAPISWDDDHGLRDVYARLIALRREVPDLASPELDLVDADGDVLVYTRGDDTLVALNFGPDPATASVGDARGLRRDLWTRRDLRIGDGLRLEGYGVRILVPPRD